ncbi:hypothetical protein CEE37_03810 [candidate division LCP-89 bacterium B3_LCP]|uniref:Secretion system C-terminal sorting domain-containing protein n=1 Tax=candidate division LCP-89 bacterium B3_LCP TaxID=2012998 RepID=A0A532V3J9_UNCL8|nr:MAG: hypothetical protein CEE37_03810 [candidate division LCP-89 bacterium B3_LCP]
MKAYLTLGRLFQSIRLTVLIMTIVLILSPNRLQSQDIYWQRVIHDVLEESQVAFYHGGVEFSKPTFVDIDNDGDFDLFVGEHDGYLNFLENSGNNPPDWICITTALDTIDIGKYSAPTFWDYDDDGDLDMFIGEEEGSIWHYRNDGTLEDPIWTFMTENFGSLGVNYHAIPFFRDLDADNDDDLLVGHDREDPIEAGAAHFLNMGSVGSPAWSYQTPNYQGLDVGDNTSVCVFDVDSDNLQDIFMAGAEGEIHYFHNEGPASTPDFLDMGVIYNPGYNACPTLCDLDSDDDLDLIAGESDGNLTLLTNIGNPNAPDWEFTQDQFAYFDAGNYSKPSLVDIDDDGDLDMFVGRIPAGVIFLENIGSPDSAAWHLVTNQYAGINLPGSEALAFGDLDNDDDIDLVAGSGDGTLTYFQNDGTPQAAVWADAVYNYTGIDLGENSTPVLADADMDGDLDLFVGSADDSLRWIQNSGTPEIPVWEDLGNYNGISVGGFSAPAIADLDFDGDLDLLVGNGGLTGHIAFYRNNGPPQPLWSLENTSYEDWDFGDHAVPYLADIDNDGDNDLLVGCAAGGLYLMENTGIILNLSILLLPYNPPIVIPEEGGTIDYIIQVENNEPQSLQIDVWTMITTPGNQIIGPLDNYSFLFAPGTRNLSTSFYVPESYEPGGYSFSSYIGIYPVPVYDVDAFDFTKEGIVAAVEPGSGTAAASKEYHFSPPHPNPFNDGTQLSYSIPTAGPVAINIYDIRGCLTATRYNGWRSAGQHQFTLQLNNIAAGIYFVQVSSGSWQAIRKVCYLP